MIEDGASPPPARATDVPPAPASATDPEPGAVSAVLTKPGNDNLRVDRWSAADAAVRLGLTAVK